MIPKHVSNCVFLVQGYINLNIVNRCRLLIGRHMCFMFAGHVSVYAIDVLWIYFPFTELIIHLFIRDEAKHFIVTYI